MKSRGFFAELKRRHVYRAGVIYAMVSWLLIQIATQVFPFFGVPEWAIRLIITPFLFLVSRLRSRCLGVRDHAGRDRRL